MSRAGSNGFTLIEVLLVVGIIATIFGLGAFASTGTYRGYSRRSERDVLASMLERSRSRAMANIGQHPWGVCLDLAVPTDPTYVIFSGSYASAYEKEQYPADPAVIFDLAAAPAFPCDSGGVVFAQLTGDADPAIISLTQGSIASMVGINAAGRIDR